MYIVCTHTHTCSINGVPINTYHVYLVNNSYVMIPVAASLRGHTEGIHVHVHFCMHQLRHSIATVRYVCLLYCGTALHMYTVCPLV